MNGVKKGVFLLSLVTPSLSQQKLKPKTKVLNMQNGNMQKKKKKEEREDNASFNKEKRCCIFLIVSVHTNREHRLKIIHTS